MPQIGEGEPGGVPETGDAQERFCAGVRAAAVEMTPRRNHVSQRYIGREAELAALAGSLDAAAGGDAGINLISGEPGIGKSRLLREFGGRALRDGWMVLSGRAYDTEGMPPFLPFVEVMRNYANSATGGRLGPIVDAAPVIATMLPEAEARTGGPPRSPESERYELFEGVSNFLFQAANSTEARGLLICLDDLHWADRSTLLLFQHLARKLTAARLCLTGTYRTTGLDSGHPLSRILSDLTRERLYEPVSLAPLSVEETSLLVAALANRKSVPPSLADALHARAKGNPFFIEELVRQLKAEGRDLDDPTLVLKDWGMPEGVRQVVGSRIARLSAEDRAFLQAAAVLGDDFGQMFPVIARMLDVEVSTLAVATEEAVTAGMLQEDAESYRFAHALIRDALLDELPLARRQRLHLTAARAMEEVFARNLEPRLSAIAVHYRMAGPFGDATKTIDYSIRAGEASEAAFAYEEARLHWEAALELMDRHGVENAVRVRLVERLGELMQVVGFDNYAKSASYFEEAIALHEKGGDHVAAAAMHARLALLLGAGSALNDNPSALRHLRAAEPFLADGPPSDARLSYYSALGLVAVWQMHASAGLAASGTAMEIAEELGEEDRWVTNAVMHSTHLHALGRVAAGLELIRRAWHKADELNNTYRAFVAANWLAMRLLDLGDPLAARAWLQGEVDQPRQIHAPTRRRMLQDCIAESYALAGDLAAARQFIAETGAGGGSELSLREGRWDEVEAFWSRQREAAPAALNRSIQANAGLWLARLRRLRGDNAGAVAALSEALAVGLDGPSLTIQLRALPELAAILAETGRCSDANEHLDCCLDILAAGEDWRGLAGRVALAQAATAGFAGSLAEADGHVDRAVAIFRRYSLLWDEAEALVLRGRIHVSAGRAHRYEASESFAKALALYAAHGAAQPWFDRVHALQRRVLRGRNGATVVCYPDGLTEREVEVLRLLAGGLSSKEMGEALVLSVRTVERHIANLYIKTRTHGRAQATAYALAHGLG